MKGYSLDNPLWKLPLCRLMCDHRQKGPSSVRGFLSIDDLASNQGELAISVEYNSINNEIAIDACTPLPQYLGPADVVAAYLSLCNSNRPQLFNQFFCSISKSDLTKTEPEPCPRPEIFTILNARTLLAIYASKKYKPVALKIRPVETELPSRFRITREIKGDPLKDMPQLSTQPPPYAPTGCYTPKQKEVIDQVHPGDFLLLEEHALLHHFMCVQNLGFAWNDSERGHFREDFFPPIEIPTIPHKPWTQKNIPILPGIYKEVCKLIKKKIDTGVYEPSNSSYRSCWFYVVKKDGKTLHIIHSLEPLNQVTIKHAGVTPFTDQIGEHFAGHACGGMLDLYIGYDEWALTKSSHNLTTFQSLFETL